MASQQIAAFRAQNPQYGDMSDSQLAVAMHRRFYADVPMVDYISKLGLNRGDVLYDLRGKDDPYGAYLREALATAGTGESEADAAKRLGGAIEMPEIGAAEGTIRAVQQGLTTAFGDELVAAGAAALDQTPNMSFNDKYGQYLSREQGKLEQFREDNPVAGYGAEIAGAVLSPVNKLFPWAGKGGSLGARMGTTALAGLGQGALYGLGAGEGDLDERTGSALMGGALGFGVGAAAPALGQGARRLISPVSSSHSQQQAAKVMASEGVTLTAGQKTGSKPLQYLESELGGSKAAALMERQSEQFTSAVLKRAGINATRATPDALDDAFTAIGGQFDQLAARTSVPLDRQLQQDLVRALSDYQAVAGMPAKGVEDMVRRIVTVAQQNGGQIGGQTYQNVRSKIGELAKRADGPTKEAFVDLQSVLDDAVERNMSPAMRKLWQDTRRRYRNLLVVERAATGAGQATASGLISPAQLRNAAINQNRRAFARGQNDFNDIANAGVQTMTPLPQSGTAPRFAAQALGAVPAAIGAAIGSPGGVAGMAGGALAGAAIPRMVGSAILSRPGRALLGNQAATGTDPNLLERALRRLPALPAMLQER